MKEAIIVGDLKLPFSHAVRAGGMIFVSGQASVDLETGNHELSAGESAVRDRLRRFYRRRRVSLKIFDPEST